MKKILLFLVSIFCVWYTQAATIGIHGVQHMDTKDILNREKENNTTISIIGLIFDKYWAEETRYLTHVVSELWTWRIYHISLSPYGHTAQEVVEGYYNRSYKRFFEDIKTLDIKVVFRTMHEMNGGRYSRASQPESFKQAWKKIHTLARDTMNISSGQLLFSLSYNSQDLPTKDYLPTQKSHYSYCSQWVVDNIGRCPRMEDYYPGDEYVDLIWVTLYNRWRSRPAYRSVRKSPQDLLTEANLFGRLSQRKKPIIIDELWTTAIKFDGTRSQNKTKEVFQTNTEDKNTRLREWVGLLRTYKSIVAIVYFNLDATQWATSQVLWQADWNIILSPYKEDYRAGKRLFTNHSDNKLFDIFSVK